MNTAHGLKYCCYPKCSSESKDKRIRHGDDRPLSIEHHKTNLIRLGHYSEDSFAVLPASHHFFHESCRQRFRREYSKQFPAAPVPVLPGPPVPSVPSSPPVPPVPPSVLSVPSISLVPSTLQPLPTPTSSSSLTPKSSASSAQSYLPQLSQLLHSHDKPLIIAWIASLPLDLLLEFFLDPYNQFKYAVEINKHAPSFSLSSSSSSPSSSSLSTHIFTSPTPTIAGKRIIPTPTLTMLGLAETQQSNKKIKSTISNSALTIMIYLHKMIY